MTDVNDNEENIALEPTKEVNDNTLFGYEGTKRYNASLDGAYIDKLNATYDKDYSDGVGGLDSEYIVLPPNVYEDIYSSACERDMHSLHDRISLKLTNLKPNETLIYGDSKKYEVRGIKIGKFTTVSKMFNYMNEFYKPSQGSILEIYSGDVGCKDSDFSWKPLTEYTGMSFYVEVITKEGI